MPLDSMDAVEYTVRFSQPGTHYAEIEALLPTGGASEIEIFLPVWTPGSYMVREYSRHVEKVRVTDGGRELPVSKTRKNRWQIDTGGASHVKVSYRIYCREMSVRTNWVEDGFALLHGAATFLTLVDGQQREHRVRLQLADGWRTTVTGMEKAPGDQPHHYTAPDYDTLVDSPILAGTPDIYQFDVDGIPHFLANEGEDGVWDALRSVRDLKRIVEHFRGMWGGLPYRKYVFINMITGAGGGLEHRNSVCMMSNRWATATRRTYLDWLGLAAHEFLHVWNVKRLRPVELGPFDYENENYTRSLWIAEGLTEYYTPLAVRRAGLCTRDEYFGTPGDAQGGKPTGLSGEIDALQNTPGRLVVSVEQASRDAWIKLYRPDENSKNTSISYYVKGAVVGWLLDARIRKSTGGAKSLDDLMRLAHARYGDAQGYTSEQFKAAAEEVAGVPLREFFLQTVESAGELDYSEALEWFGIRFRTSVASGPAKAWTGAITKIDSGRLLVAQIPRGTPAYGRLNVEDEIIGIGDFRVKPEHFAQRLECYRPGERVSILVARREKFARVEVVLGAEPTSSWQLEVDPAATTAQRSNLDAWLGL